jgi:hypothetical protein
MPGPINIGDAKPAWVITGGESGPHFRRIEVDWVRSIRDQCRRTQSVLSAALNGWLRIIHRIIQGFHKRRNNVRISAKNLQKIYRTFSCLYTALQNHPRLS